MYMIVCGAGEVGYSIAETLSRVGHDVTLIEKDRRAIDRAKALNVKLLHGNGAKMDVLDNADIDEADFYFGLTDDDEANMLGCVIAKSRGASTIARLNSMRYISKPISRRFASIGIDIAVCPKLVVVDKITKIISIPALMNKTYMAKGKMVLVEAKVPPTSPLRNKRVEEIDLPKGFLIGTIFRGIKVIVPRGKTIVREGDRLVLVLDTPARIPELERIVGEIRKERESPTNRVMLIGAGNMSVHLARELGGKRIEMTVIDGDDGRCKRAAGILNKAVVIHGDPMDKQLLIEEGLEDMDAMVAITNSQATNVLVSLLAKVYEIPKVISLISRNSMKSMLETVGIDLAVSGKNLTVEAIMHEVEQLEILRTVKLHGGDIIVFETKVGRRSSTTGSKIVDLRLPRGVLIVGVLRKGRTFIPGGDFRLKKRDRVLVICYQERMERIDRLFRGKGLIL